MVGSGPVHLAQKGPLRPFFNEKNDKISSGWPRRLGLGSKVLFCKVLSEFISFRGDRSVNGSGPAQYPPKKAHFDQNMVKKS